MIEITREDIHAFNEQLRMAAAQMPDGENWSDRFECLLHTTVKDIDGDALEAWRGAAELAQVVVATTQVVARSPRLVRGDVAVNSMVTLGGIASRIIEAYLERKERDDGASTHDDG